MWSSSGSPATLPRHTAGSSAPVDWDSLLPLLPESVRCCARFWKMMPPCTGFWNTAAA